MRIFCYTKEFPPEEGGLETYAFQVVQHLQQFGHEVLVAVRHMEGDAEYDRQASLRIERLKAYFKPTALYRAYSYWTVPRLIQKHRADVAFLPYWFRFSSVIPWFARYRKLPYFVTCHGEEVAFPPGQLSHTRKRMLNGLQGALRVYTNSTHTRELCLGHGLAPDRVEVMGGGVVPTDFKVDASRVEALRDRLGVRGKIVLLTVAHLREKKGHDYVLQAMARSGRDDVHYVLVGRGDHEAALRQQAKDLGLADRVHFQGFVPDDELPLYYHLADLFVLTTRDTDGSNRTEGLGLVYLEANVCGTPVLAGDVGGVREAVEDGVNGLLVDSSHIEAIAKGLSRLLEDPALRERLGEQGRRRIFEGGFTWEAVARRYEQSMLAALESRSASAAVS
ncbi:MAG: glycosyltransferase family 4 protein [Planctomycetota bacterium]